MGSTKPETSFFITAGLSAGTAAAAAAAGAAATGEAAAGGSLGPSKRTPASYQEHTPSATFLLRHTPAGSAMPAAAKPAPAAAAALALPERAATAATPEAGSRRQFTLAHAGARALAAWMTGIGWSRDAAPETTEYSIGDRRL